MSSDLYSSSLNEDKHGALTIEMNVHGTLFITAYDNGGDEQVARFMLEPNAENFKEAAYIINALETWIHHNKSIVSLIAKEYKEEK